MTLGKAVALFTSSFLVAAASSAATLQILYVPPTGGAVRDAPLTPRKPNLAPMPAPADLRHYAGPTPNFTRKTWAI
jgi:hypothetical protein